jgi:hypothetical protein
VVREGERLKKSIGAEFGVHRLAHHTSRWMNDCIGSKKKLAFPPTRNETSTDGVFDVWDSSLQTPKAVSAT